jgi:hypothetical protein
MRAKQLAIFYTHAVLGIAISDSIGIFALFGPDIVLSAHTAATKVHQWDFVRRSREKTTIFSHTFTYTVFHNKPCRRILSTSLKKGKVWVCTS